MQLGKIKESDLTPLHDLAFNMITTSSDPETINNGRILKQILTEYPKLIEEVRRRQDVRSLLNMRKVL